MLPPISDDQPVPGDARWVEAEELLSGTPTDAARRWLIRAHRQRVLVVAGLVLVLGALAVPIGFLVADVDGGDTSTDVPLWQAVAVPSWWRVGVAVGFVLLVAVGSCLVQRDLRAARASLVAHPDLG